jgi:hypothetical protein
VGTIAKGAGSKADITPDGSEAKRAQVVYT